MKNLLCTLMLAFGLIITAQAQSLNVITGTDLAGNWTLQVAESNGAFHTFSPVNIGNTPQNFNFTGPVSLPFFWRLQDPFGCGAGTFTITGTGSGSQAACTATVNWTVNQDVLGNYTFIAKIQ